MPTAASTDQKATLFLSGREFILYIYNFGNITKHTWFDQAKILPVFTAQYAVNQNLLAY
jgi:hypothetical protein